MLACKYCVSMWIVLLPMDTVLLCTVDSVLACEVLDSCLPGSFLVSSSAHSVFASKSVFTLLKKIVFKQYSTLTCIFHTPHGNCTNSEDKAEHRSSSGSDYLKDLLRWD